MYTLEKFREGNLKMVTSVLLVLFYLIYNWKTLTCNHFQRTKIFKIHMEVQKLVKTASHRGCGCRLLICHRDGLLDGELELPDVGI